MRKLAVADEEFWDALFEGVYLVDLDRRITYWNKGAERITGFKKEEVVGSCCHDNILRHIDEDGRELCLMGCPLLATMNSGVASEAKVFLHHKFGHRLPVTVRTLALKNDAGEVIGGVEIFIDNSSVIQVLAEFEKLREEAYHDALTGVGNRRYAESALQTRMFDLKNSAISFGVIFADIDHFKRVNDIYGHNTGDEVLGMVARTISNALRSIDVVARWGGEEFVVLLPGVNQSLLNSIAERVRKLVEQSFLMVGKERLSVSISLGATLARPNDTVGSLITRADALMYKSKNNGRNMVSCD